MAISLRRLLPTGSSTLPAPKAPDRCCPRRWRTNFRGRGLLGLARGGVCLAIVVTNDPVCSYHTFSPLPPEGALEHDGFVMVWRPFQRRFVSVALSLTPPSPAKPVGVTHHRVLPCSDFPRDRASPTPRPSRPRHTPIISAILPWPFGLNRQGAKCAKEGRKQ